MIIILLIQKANRACYSYSLTAISSKTLAEILQSVAERGRSDKSVLTDKQSRTTGSPQYMWKGHRHKGS